MKIKTVPAFVLLVCAAFVSGCASTPPTGCPSSKTWYQPGVSQADTTRDLAACQYDAIATERGYSVQGNTVGQTLLLAEFASSQERGRENEIVESCMREKGYTLVDTNSLLLKQENVVSPEVAAELLGHWLFVAPQELPLRGQCEIYYLPEYHYKVISNLTYTNGEPVSKTSEEKGRYYFVGNELVHWPDTKDKPNNPIIFTATEQPTNIFFKRAGANDFQKTRTITRI